MANPLLVICADRISIFLKSSMDQKTIKNQRYFAGRASGYEDIKKLIESGIFEKDRLITLLTALRRKMLEASTNQRTIKSARYFEGTATTYHEFIEELKKL